MSHSKTCCLPQTSTLKTDGGPSKTKKARMMDGPVCDSKSAGQPLDLHNILQREKACIAGPDYLMWASTFVSRNKRKTEKLKKPADAIWTVGDLDDTIYSGNKKLVDGWGEFYLPKIVSMKVLGVVEGIPSLCNQLVLMTCEDKKLYAYDGEELHEVASSLKQLRDKGIEYPASKSYYKGEAFKNMTKKDWDEVRNSPEGKRLDEAHHELVIEKKAKFLENLKSTRD